MNSVDHTVVTIVRLRFKQEGKYAARRSSEWYAAMQRFRKLPNWRYTSAGEGIDDAAEVPLFIGESNLKLCLGTCSSSTGTYTCPAELTQVRRRMDRQQAAGGLLHVSSARRGHGSGN